MVTRQPRPAYHHGNLRQACIDEGLRLLERKGKEAVTLRAIARSCRVSPRAPYQHFRDKTEFLAALAERGFGQFAAALAGSTNDGLPGFARAYLAFAAAHPALTQLMFGDDFAERARRNPELDRAAKAAFGLLQEAVARARPTMDARKHRLLAVNAWALVHGLSELARQGQLEHVLADGDELAEVVELGAALFTANDTRSIREQTPTARRPRPARQ